ncbi:MAPEG family protein [Pleionea sp. CnH1-48]|uniref:MAPEG family protein n=1 Tax=Pleionea sp. CnH1-48 TaxID=2954494 RepID=UPI002097E710|nr:MAPEG family protein [Pleionea sp. CnH1-48]MCO7226833.1 MAPEG family protein [Pleionea sp. CnH1-48]
MMLSITGLYAAPLALLILFLAYRVTKFRRKLLVGVGSGGDKELEGAIRAHANAIEYVPIALIIIAILEVNGSAEYFVHGLGATLLIGRILHAQGLSSSIGKSFGRFWGTLLTWLVILIASVSNLVLFVMN